MTHYLRALVTRLRRLFGNCGADRDLNDEIETHLRLLTERYVRQGMSEAEAAWAARRQFGNVTLLQEVNREMRGIRFIETLFQDLRYGVRMLAKNRVFTFVAILTLAFGIGANTAIFSVIHAVLLSPLPYPQSERMVMLGVTGGDAPLTAPEFVEIEKENQLLEHSSTFDAREFILTGRGAPELLKGQRISSGLLALFGVHPNPGRSFSAEEFQPGRDQVVLISHRLWQSRWGGDPNLIGQSVTLQRQSYTVIGIIPQSFNFFADTDVLVPWAFAEALSNPYADVAHVVKTVARLKPGVTTERAQRELSAIVSSFEKSTEMRVHPLREMMARDFRPTLFTLWGVVGCVLLIACANFVNLLLARGRIAKRRSRSAWLLARAAFASSGSC